MSMAVEPARVKKEPWRYDEDAVLQHEVAEHGLRSWKEISRNIPGRSVESCGLRWSNQISSAVEHGPFAPREDEIIPQAHQKYGDKWAASGRLLPGRTDSSVKNHSNSMLKRRCSSSQRDGAGARLLKRANVQGLCLNPSSTSASGSGSDVRDSSDWMVVAVPEVAHRVHCPVTRAGGLVPPSSTTSSLSMHRLEEAASASLSKGSSDNIGKDSLDTSLSLALPGFKLPCKGSYRQRQQPVSEPAQSQHCPEGAASTLVSKDSSANTSDNDGVDTSLTLALPGFALPCKASGLQCQQPVSEPPQHLRPQVADSCSELRSDGKHISAGLSRSPRLLALMQDMIRKEVRSYVSHLLQSRTPATEICLPLPPPMSFASSALCLPFLLSGNFESAPGGQQFPSS